MTYVPVNNFSVLLVFFLGWNSTKQMINLLLKDTFHSASDEARISDPLISSGALYHWATALLKDVHVGWGCPRIQHINNKTK